MIKFVAILVMAILACVVSAATSSGSEMNNDVVDQDGRRRRLLGGYSGSFCARTLADCCGERDVDGRYPDCRCPIRRKGGLDDPYCLFGICTGSYTEICDTCTTRCGAGGDLDCTSSE
jgi:hypothetical protein